MRRVGCAALLAVAVAAAGAAAQANREPLTRRLAGLTLEAKAGQLFVAWCLTRERGQAAARAALRRHVRDVGLGGVILSLGAADEAVPLILDLQAEAQVPLLLAGDFETGLAFRLTQTTHFGSNMLVAATGVPELARQEGRATAREGRALGFHWAFAPVVDVNVNAANPIINVRSYGERPARVAAFAGAFVRGLEGAGMLATAKHFPGHGDVATDSHLALPTVPGDRARWERVEAPPFRAAIAAGAASIMTGHLAVPGLGEAADVPATLSPKILGDLLRGELGFTGLIVTDALNMGGVKGALPPEEVAVRALLAGADVLLFPPDPAKARAGVVAAVRAGRVPEQRLDAAVLRILAAKQRSGLLDGGGLPARDWRQHVRTPAHLELAREIAGRGITLVRDRQGAVPLKARPTLVVTVLDAAGDARGAVFRGAFGVRGLVLSPASTAAEVAAAAAAVRDAGRPIVAMHVKVRSFSGRIGLPARFDPLVAALRQQPGAVVVSFGNPYLVTAFPEVSSYLCAYNEGEFTEAAAAAVLRGEAGVTGRLPVAIPEIAAVGAGVSWLPPAERLPRAAPLSEGLAADLGDRLEQRLAVGVRERAFPGAVALVARRGRVVAHVAVGRETYAEDAAAVARDALFDLASLTKVCATGPAVLRLVARGALSLDARVADLVPAFAGVGKAGVTVRHLMTHAAGLPSYVRFFRTLKGKAAIVEAAAREGLMVEPETRTIYSDVGLILLMACVEQAAGKPFDAVARDEVFAPLGMTGARFTRTGEPVAAMPTEVDDWRGRLVRGQAHDENAYAMGGVSGHAGLFATAEDVAKLALAYLGGGRGWLPSPLARAAVRPVGLVAGSSRALCWDTFRSGGSGGTKLSPRAFGHTGFTGTSVWCDPATDLCIVLLTNRVHPTRVNGKIAAVRREMADLVVDALQ